jgi:hypothetical protein
MAILEENNQPFALIQVDALYFVVLKKFVINRKHIGGVFPFHKYENAKEFLVKENRKPTEFHFELLTTTKEMIQYCESHGLNFRDYEFVKMTEADFKKK